MPQSTRADASALPPSVDEEFLQLLCAEEELLRAEFDAIIAAEWPSPPPTEPARGAGGQRRPHHPRLRCGDSVAAPPNQPRRPGIGGWAGQRSPPPAGTRDRKGR